MPTRQRLQPGRVGLLALALTALLPLAAAPARATTCAVDDPPAATLLLPYFEVDLDDVQGQGRTTLFSVNNADPRAALAEVVLWTDLGVPTLSFQIYLTGFDVQTLNLRDIFAGGNLPRTADRDRDPNDATSPQGPLSQDLSFPGCAGILPYSQPVLPPAFLQHLRAAHTGGPSSILSGRCSGRSFGDNVARGYVTVDLIKSCTLLNPSDAGYYGPNGFIDNRNVLWGDYYQVDPGGHFASGDNLVRLEADPAAFGAGETTFYGRFSGRSAVDAREPLATTWASRYLEGGPFSGGTSLVVWRDPGRPAETFECGSRPSWQPLGRGRVTLFDEEENSHDFAGVAGQPAPFDFVAGRVSVGGALAPTSPFGWAFLDLGRAGGDPATQSWVGTTFSASGLYSAGMEATALDSACAPDRCLVGDQAEIGQLCLLGTDGAVHRNEPLTFRVVPKGCFSSSCTRIVQATCTAALRGTEIVLDPLICQQSTAAPGTPCTPDCSGGGQASCTLAAGVPAGNYTVRAGGLTLPVRIPTTVPAGGLCTGSPF
ncbi:MAG TPA: hypothetical protein VHU81_17155 [Thermoanaerobaculia bacterium]|nr:hypothetical protein [Thermoanaerobaculia bacterium]